MKHPFIFVLLTLALQASCVEGFDPADELKGLRVLAVRKSQPYAQPGERVELELLWHDEDPARQGETPQIAWLALCENPASDLFELCFAQIGRQFAELALAGEDFSDPSSLPELIRSRFSLPSETQDGPNDAFSFQVSPDIISTHPLATPDAQPYGLTFVFFAVCAGQLQLQLEGQFPFACFRDGERLGAEGFVVGYSSVFSYPEFTNENPILLPYVEFGDHTFANGEASDEPRPSIQLTTRDLCFGSECQPVTMSTEPDVCPAELTIDICDDDCPEIPFRLGLDPMSAEPDPTAPVFEGERLEEQMWVNYYATGGSFPGGAVRLLNDALEGWNDDYGTDYSPHDEPGVHYLWAVAHDNRGGVAWARLRVCSVAGAAE